MYRKSRTIGHRFHTKYILRAAQDAKTRSGSALRSFKVGSPPRSRHCTLVTHRTHKTYRIKSYSKKDAMKNPTTYCVTLFNCLFDEEKKECVCEIVTINVYPSRIKIHAERHKTVCTLVNVLQAFVKHIRYLKLYLSVLNGSWYLFLVSFILWISVL